MKVFVCYYEYEGWDSCSHPVRVFFSKEEADNWQKSFKQEEGSWARVLEMEEGRGYLPR